MSLVVRRTQTCLSILRLALERLWEHGGVPVVAFEVRQIKASVPKP